MFYLIYQPGKVASQTLEVSIARSDPSARVERHHYLEPGNLAEFERVSELEGSGSAVEATRTQTEAARPVLAAVAREDPRNLWVLTGFRDPLDFAISAYFQNLSDFCPAYNSPAPDENYDPVRFDAEVDRVIDAFNAEVAAYLQRVRLGLPVRNVRELELQIKLRNLGDWFDLEFKPVFGLDVYDIELESKPFVRFSNERGNFLLYRMETLREALPALLAELPLPAKAKLVDQNLASQKDYAVLYHRFRERFVPTAEMVAYYYGGRFFRHFYGDAEPLYTVDRPGNRLLV